MISAFGKSSSRSNRNGIGPPAPMSTALWPQALEANGAVLVVRRRERMAERAERVGDRSAELSGVHGIAEHAPLDHAGEDAPERGRERGLAEPPVPAVRDDHRVAGQALALA